MSCANTEHQFENDIEELMTTELGWTKASERSYLKWGEMQRYSRGIADFRLRLYWPEFKNIKIPCPPLEEQRAIANELDEKCAAIDALIAEKEALIADLEAYWKSLIFEVVTGKREVA